MKAKTAVAAIAWALRRFKLLVSADERDRVIGQIVRRLRIWI